MICFAADATSSECGCEAVQFFKKERTREVWGYCEKHRKSDPWIGLFCPGYAWELASEQEVAIYEVHQT